MSLVSPTSPSSAAGHRQTEAEALGLWLPLASIAHGAVVHTFRPSVPPPTPTKNGESSKAAAYRNRFSWSGLNGGLAAAADGTEDVTTQAHGNPYEVPLELGDEIFAFETYKTARDGQEDVWYRGYVVQATPLSALQAVESSSSTSYAAPRPEPSVLIGIFPASCVNIRQTSMGQDEDDTAAAYDAAMRLLERRRQRGGERWDISTVHEEDEGGATPSAAKGKGRAAANGESSSHDFEDIATSPGALATPSKRRSVLAVRGLNRSSRPMSLDLGGAGPARDSGRPKAQPPLPRMVAGDTTAGGAQWPLVDEIACAVRDWHGRLPTYLASKEYRLFNHVVQHIDALLLGRRQLLSRTLSTDELAKVKRECVSRMVKCNIAQGLEVIVRDIEDGSVVVTDTQRAFEGTKAVSGIECYVEQLKFAYIDAVPLVTTSTRLQLSSQPSPSSNGLNHLASPGSKASMLASTASAPAATISNDFTGRLYQLVLDIRAFIASPCAPGELIELYFSVYDSRKDEFLTEEFCLVLNHLGAPARDTEQRLGRLRTVFTDLKPEELDGPVFLVCKLVRNGAARSPAENSSSRLNALNGSFVGRSTMTSLRSPSIATLTDDSFSVTGSYAARRTITNDTGPTATSASSVHGAVRRPFGCAVVDLARFRHLSAHGPSASEGTECSMPIYVPNSETGFASLHQAVIQQDINAFKVSPKAQSIVINLRWLRGSAAEAVRTHPALLLDIPLTARLGFTDVVQPGESRNDVYIKLLSGTFSAFTMPSDGSIRTRKSIVPSAPGDFEIDIELRRSDGTTVFDALFAGGSGEPAVEQYRSMVLHHNDRPVFGELLKASLPVDLADCHLFLTVRSPRRERANAPDLSDREKPHGFAFFPLLGPEIKAKDGDHTLIVYRVEHGTEPSPSAYLSAPPSESSSAAYDRSGSLKPLPDRIVIRTSLVSSVHSQDPVVGALLARHASSTLPVDLKQTLQMFTFVSENEIAKHIPRILEALFGIALSLGANDTELADLCFQALIKVLSMSSDRRFPGAQSLIERYVDADFDHPGAFGLLLSMMRSTLSKPDSQDCRSFLKVWHLFFRILIQCRGSPASRTVGMDFTADFIHTDFQRQLKGILQDLNRLMSSGTTSIGTKTLVVQRYASLLPGLRRVYPAEELAEIVIEFVDTLTGATGSIISYKLLLLLQVIEIAFDTSPSRAVLIPALVRWVKPHMGRLVENADSSTSKTETGQDVRRIKWLETNRLAISVIARVVQALQGSAPASNEDLEAEDGNDDNLEYCLSLVPALLQSYTEHSSPASQACLARSRGTNSTISVAYPDAFPSSHPPALITDLPPLSLLSRSLQGDDESLLHPGHFYMAQAETAVVITSLFLACPRSFISRWLVETMDIEGRSATSSLLQALIAFAASVIRSAAFPASSLTLNLVIFQSVVRLLVPITSLLEKPDFIPPPDQTERFDLKLWTDYLTLICDILDSDALAIEKHGAQRRRAEWIVCGDMRDEVAEIFLRSWNALGWSAALQASSDSESIKRQYGGYQTRLTGMSDRVLALCLSSHDFVMETGAEVLFSMLHADYILDSNFDSIQSRIFASLDTLFSSKTMDKSADPALKAYFVTVLRDIHEASPTPSEAFHRAVGGFLDQIELFVDQLIALRAIPDRPDWTPERKSILYRLMHFAQSLGRDDLYARFYTQFIQLCTGSKDHLSAGLCLQALANSYGWDDLQQVEPWQLDRVLLPAQAKCRRKEALLYYAIDYLAEAEAYELMLQISSSLLEHYQSSPRDVAKIAELLRYQADVWNKIGQSVRLQPLYFRVALFVESEPAEDYVVRGEPFQRYVDFCEIMMVKFPAATMHRSKIPPSHMLRNNGQDVLWITTVNPEADLARAVFDQQVPEAVQAWWRHNDIKKFSSSRPYILDAEDTSGMLVWTEKTIIETVNSLPHLLGRSEVESVRYEQISPIDSALSEVRKATRSLQSASNSQPVPKLDVKHLGTVINGAVDSPVNGGVSRYRQVFLSPEYAERYPDDRKKVEEVRLAILDYVRAIQEALAVHRLVCQDTPFHEALRSHFLRAYQGEIALLPSQYSDSSRLPPVPPKDSNQPRGIHVHSPSMNLIREIPTPISPAYQLPPLRLGPSPSTIPISMAFTIPSDSPASSPPITIDRRASGSLKASASTGQDDSAALSHRASSIMGSMSTRSSNAPSIGRADSVRTQTGTNGGSISERRSSLMSETSQHTISEVAQPTAAGPNGSQREGKAEKRLSIKRLSTLMRRNSRSSTEDRIPE